MVLIFLLLIIFLNVVQTFSQNTVIQLTMDDAVQHALQHNPNLEALCYAERAARCNADAERAGYLPTVTLTSDFSKEPGQKTIKSVTALSANQLIYSFAGPLQKGERAKNLTAIAVFDKQVQANVIRLKTEEIFLQTWLLQEQRKTTTALKASAEAIFKRQSQKNKLEQLNKTEWLRDIGQYSQALVSIDHYEHDLLIAYNKLAFLMGESLVLDPTINLVWHGKKNYRLKSLNNYYQLALTNRPEVPQSIKSIAVEKCNVKLARGQRLPFVTANAQTGLIVTPASNVAGVILGQDPEVIPQSSLQDNSKESTSFWRLSLSFNWPIFDGLVTYHREQQADAERIRKLCEREQLVLGIKQEVHGKYYTLLKHLKQLQTQKVYYLRNFHEFTFAKQKYELNKSSRIEFNEALVAWEQTRLDWCERNVKLELAERALMYACGYPAWVNQGYNQS